MLYRKCYIEKVTLCKSGGINIGDQIWHIDVKQENVKHQKTLDGLHLIVHYYVSKL